MSPASSSVTEETRKRRSDRRFLVAQLLIASLIALAYQEAVTPVRESVRASGVTFGTGILFYVFFLTSIRFFIGNFLHMQILAENDLPGGLWLHDLIWITFQTTLFIFLGGVCSVEVSRKVPVHFVTLLLAIFVVDIAWIASQWIIAQAVRSWRRESYPWPWLALNGIQTAIILLLGIFAFRGDFYGGTMLSWLAVVSTIAFVVDVMLVDWAGLLE